MVKILRLNIIAVGIFVQIVFGRSGLLDNSEESPVSEKWTPRQVKRYLQDGGQRVFKLVSEPFKGEIYDGLFGGSGGRSAWKFWETDDSSNVGLFGDSKGQSVSTWIFNSWNTDDLKLLLRKSKIPVPKNASKDLLVSVAQNNYKKICNHLGISGSELSESFLKYWDRSVLEKWLNDYGISCEEDASRDSLVKKVKTNMNKVSNFLEDERYEFLSSLNIMGDKFREMGNFDHVNFGDWSPDNLKRWLSIHGVKINDKIAQNKDELIKFATQKKDLLSSDLQWVENIAEKGMNAFIKKGDKAIGSVMQDTVENFNGVSSDDGENADVIQDTFMLDVESWPKDKLKQFLDSRNVEYPTLSTRSQLVKLVNQYKNKPLTNWATLGKIGFCSLSLDKVKGIMNPMGTHNHGDGTTDMLNDATSKISSTVEDLDNSINKKLDHWSNFFESWSVDDLTSYLKSFGHTPSIESTKEKLVKMASANSRSFFGERQHTRSSNMFSKKVQEWINRWKSYILYN